MKLNYKRTIFVGFAFFLISAFWQAYDAIVPLILTNHYGLPQTVSGFVMSFDNILAVFLLPIFGGISDKVSTRFGKRTPFIVIGTVAAILSFLALSLVDMAQLSSIAESGILNDYNIASEAVAAAKDALSAAKDSGIEASIKAAEAVLETAESNLAAELEIVRSATQELVKQNLFGIIGFIAVLLIVLVSMATFRSPAVALMPDVTVKPLRSKGNAIINLMGTAGGILVLVLGMIFGTSKDLFMSYTPYIIAVCGIMAVGLAVFLLKVREPKWVLEMEEESRKYGLEETDSEKSVDTEPKRKLSRPEFISLMLILASVALWYIGYNSITSKYSVYATNVLGFDFNVTLIVAQAAAVISYIPVGMVASKIGRRKTILAGILMLATAFLLGSFITSKSPELLMYPVFILAGVGWATINVNSFPMVVELAKGGDVGKYTGFYYTASMSAQIFAPIASGLIVDSAGSWKFFFPFGALFVAFSFVTMFFVKHGDAAPETKSVLESLGGADD